MKKILVIEDSGVGRLYMESLFEKIDKTEVVMCSSSEQALEYAGNEKFDLILIDYYMLSGTAETVIADIKESGGKNVDTPAVVMGREGDFSEKDFLKKHGFVNYLEKPVQFNMLRGVVELYA